MSPSVVVASILINLLSLVMPLAVMQVYDRIVPRHALEALSSLLFIVAGVIIVEALLRVARSYVVTWSATRLAWQAFREVLTRLLHAPDSISERESASRNLDRAQALMTFAEWHGSPSRLVLIDVPFVAFFLGLAAITGGWLAVIPVILFAVLGIVAIRRGEALRKASTERATEDMKIRDFLTETLVGLTTVKANAMEPQMLRRFERLQETLADRSARIVRLSEEAQAFAGLLSNLTQMVTVTVGAVFVINGELSVGTLACCVMLSGRAVQPLLRCVAVWNELQAVVVGLEKAEPLLKLPAIQQIKQQETSGGPLEVILSDVSLNFPDGGSQLDDISLHLPAGSVMALMGRDGSGKSTLVDVLCGRRRPDSGNVFIDGKNLAAVGQAYKGSISVVRASNMSVRGTILENITMFRRGDEVLYAKEAARLIGLDADVQRLPLGYDTPLSEGVSAELPPGIIQRIAIARGIARRPGLLVLDEANSGLDMRADQLLARGLQKLKGHTTIILITNRPSFARLADQAYRIENKRLEPIAVQAPVREAVA
ncbi:MAG: ATP-binding cassette domain-containing protein [Hyphomicrobiaceae bacterium]|nr:ATP-binding cassette domain-containing protein [Hyphomicrobiaceae bacterium]